MNTPISSQRTIQMLPDDVLNLIFLYSGPSRIRNSVPDIKSVSPMNISLVCRSWRALVTAQPSLWGKLEVDIRTMRLLNQPLARLVEKWLQNSSSALLSFRVNISANSTSRDPVVESIATQLLSQAHRWKDVELNLRCMHLRSFLGEIHLPFMPSLSSLWIGIDECYGSLGHGEQTVALDLSRCRQLRALTVRFGLKLRLVGQQSICLHRLSELSLCVDASVFEDFRKVLMASANLVNLDVAFTGTSTFVQDASSDGSVPLINLVQMSLVDDNHWHALATQFLGWLTCPKLQTFNAENTYSSDTSDTPAVYGITSNLLSAFDSFFRRSRPPLSRLHLEYGIGKNEHPASAYEEYSPILSRILGHLGGLELLHITGFAVDDCLFKEMTFREGETAIICPLLSDVHMECYGEVVAVRVLADMIVSRWKSGRLLKYLALDMRIPDLESLLLEFPEVKRCVDEGFSLTSFGQ